MKRLRYYEIKPYENISNFIKRVKYEIGYLDFVVISCSETMGKGVQVLHLMSTTDNSDQIKLEVYEDQMKELKDAFNKLYIPKESSSKKVIKKMNTIEGMTDLY